MQSKSARRSASRRSRWMPSATCWRASSRRVRPRSTRHSWRSSKSKACATLAAPPLPLWSASSPGTTPPAPRFLPLRRAIWRTGRSSWRAFSSAPTLGSSEIGLTPTLTAILTVNPTRGHRFSAPVQPSPVSTSSPRTLAAPMRRGVVRRSRRPRRSSQSGVQRRPSPRRRGPPSRRRPGSNCRSNRCRCCPKRSTASRSSSRPSNPSPSEAPRPCGPSSFRSSESSPRRPRAAFSSAPSPCAAGALTSLPAGTNPSCRRTRPSKSKSRSAPTSQRVCAAGCVENLIRLTLD
mmetsp:Transcript_25355/g.78261  ORF Transcript_25355/g.78261 Transcript_25355/m.78261 type:complete len:292 (-) Transcript_25355:8-883(-)